ncbi:PQQ-binding-like beta-propeller repeat protein [Streptomyces indicus]|uniref:outer membrane protein assembly factor BamB family protein n=1 Tax=Streptomyces indicus TaxID=417292 RepID=UPI00159FE267|nr:PQQ-binding-like beta-propeller repeat protein [Streptomyces indicus]
MAVALAVLAGTGWFLWPGSGSGDDGKSAASAPKAGDVVTTVEKEPKTPEGELIAEMVPGDDIPPGVTARTPGSWATKDTYAKSDGGAVYGHHAKNAKQKWRLQLPGEICAASRHVTFGGMTAVVTEEKFGTAPAEESCAEVIAFDVNTGKQLWRKHIEQAEGSPPFMLGVTVSQGVAAVTWVEGSSAFDLATGKQRWTKNAASTCRDTDFGGGPELVAIAHCGDYDAPVVKAQKLNPLTGEAEWTYRVSPGIKQVEVLSTEPTLLGLSAGDALTTDIVALDDNGKLRSLIRLEDGKYRVRCGPGMEQCRGYAATRDTLYLGTKEGDALDLDSPANEIVGFDLDTGKIRGKRFPARPLAPLAPLRMSGDKVIAQRSFAHTGVILSLDPATGEQKVLMIYPKGDDDGMLNDVYRSEALYEHGRLFLSENMMERPPKNKKGEVPDADKPVILIFGPAL